MYIWLKLLMSVASAISACTCPDTVSGVGPRDSMIPFSFESIFLSSFVASAESLTPLSSSCALRFRQSTSGSWRSVPITSNSASRCVRSCSSVSSHTRRKTPSTPVTPIAWIRFCVRRKGTRSGCSKLRP